MLELNITGQRLTRTDNTFVVADSLNYLKAHFTVSNDWTGVITTVWGHDGEYYAMVLDENKECVIPWEVIKTGTMVVSAFCGNLVTANALSINVTASGYTDGAIPEEPTEEVYNQIIALINALQADIDAIELNNLTVEEVQDLIDTSLEDYSTTTQMNQAIADAISGSGMVDSVNNQLPVDGNVSIDADDIPETTTRKYVPGYTGDGPELHFLNGNNEFRQIAVGNSGAPKNIYLTDATSDTNASYKALSNVNEEATTTVNITVSNSGDVLGHQYLFDTPIGVTNIDAGNWVATTQVKVDKPNDVTRLRFDVFKYSSEGVVTVLFSSYSCDINNTTYATMKCEVYQNNITILETDRLGLRVYGTTTHNSNVVISYQIGNGTASYLNTPIQMTHNQLRFLNGDNNYLHVSNIGTFPNLIDDYNLRSPYGYWNLGYRNDTIQCDVRDDYTKFTSAHSGEKYIYDTFTVQNGHKYLLLMSYRILSTNNTVQLRLGVATPPYYLAGNTSLPIDADFAQTGYIYEHSSADVTGFFQIIDTSSNALDMDIEYCVLLDITGTDFLFNEFVEKYITNMYDLQENVIYAGEIPKIDYLMDKVIEQDEKYYIAKNSNIFDKNFISTNGIKMEDENGTEFVMKSMGFYNNVGYIATDQYSSPLGSTNGIIETHNEDTYRELSALGFNSVRFYMTYEWFEDADIPVIDNTLAGDPTDYKQEAWEFLDAEIEMARRHNIRLCLNMHVYQGLGGKEDVDLWTDSDTQTRLINLWKAIARKYSNEDFILGFGLINEPNITWDTDEATTIGIYQTLSNSIVTEIRKVDTNHIIFSECAIAGVLPDESKVFTLNNNLNFIDVLNNGVEDTNYVYEAHHYQPIALSHNASDYNHPSMVYPNDLALYSWDGTYTYVNTKSGNRTIAQGGADETTYTAITTGIITPDTGVNFIFPFINVFNAGGGEVIDIDNYKIKIYDSANNEVFTAFEDDCQNGAIFTTKDNYWTVEEVTGTGDGDTKFLRLTVLNELNSNTSYSAMTDIGDGGVALAKRFIIPDGYKYSVECKVKITNVQSDHNVTAVIGCDEISTPYQFAYNIQLHEKLLYDYKSFTDAAGVPFFVGEFGTRDDSYTKGGDLWVHDAIKVFLDNNVSHNYHDYNEPFTGNTFSFYEQLHDERFKNKRLEYIFKQCYLADLTAEEVTKIYQEVYGGN